MASQHHTCRYKKQFLSGQVHEYLYVPVVLISTGKSKACEWLNGHWSLEVVSKTLWVNGQEGAHLVPVIEFLEQGMIALIYCI